MTPEEFKDHLDILYNTCGINCFGKSCDDCILQSKNTGQSYCLYFFIAKHFKLNVSSIFNRYKHEYAYTPEEFMEIIKDLCSSIDCDKCECGQCIRISDSPFVLECLRNIVKQYW